MKIGIVQQHNSADIDDNIARQQAKIRLLAHQGAELIVLQELHDSLYFCQREDPHCFQLAESIPGHLTKLYADIAKECSVVIVLPMFERRAPGIYHNSVAVIEKDGSLAGIYRKMHIPDDPGYYEKFYFTQGDLGFNPIQTSVGKLGVLICWDQWYPEAARLMAMAGADLLIYPTAIGWYSGDSADEQQRQLDAWLTIQRSHAVANGMPVVSVNRVGYESDPSGERDGITFWGNSFVCGPQGEFLYRAPGDEEVSTVVDVDLKRIDKVRCAWPFFRDRRIDEYGDLIKRWRI